MTTPMPEALREQALIREWNGFGLQAPCGGEDQHYRVCILNGIEEPGETSGRYKRTELSDAEVEQLRTASGSTTLEQAGFYRGSFFKIHWSEHDKLEAVLDGLVKLGFNFQLCLKTLPSFGSSRGDVGFKWSDIEKRLIEDAEKMLAVKHLEYIVLEGDGYQNHFDLWNWQTTEGKEFCRRLRKLADKPDRNETGDPDNYYHWKRYCDYDQWKAEKESNAPPAKKARLH